MITVAEGIFERKMHEYVKKADKAGEEIVVTSNRVPVLKITSLKKKITNVDDYPLHKIMSQFLHDDEKYSKFRIFIQY